MPDNIISPRALYKRAVGPKYNKDLTTVEIAARFRADVKAAIAQGELPAGLELKVRTKYFSMGSSIDVTIAACPGLVILNPERVRADLEPWVPGQPTLPLYTPEAAALQKRITAMLEAYNFDGSDLQTDYHDVHFYSHVQFAGVLTRAVRP